MPKRKSPQTRQAASSWPVTYRWLATGTLIAYTAIGCRELGAAPFPQQRSP